MFKPIKSLISIYIFHIFFLYVISFAFQNLFFIPAMNITLLILLIIGITYIIILFPHYQAKIDEKLYIVQNKEHKKNNNQFDHLYIQYKLYYKLLFLIPLLIIFYIEFIPKGIYTVTDFENIIINPSGHYTLMNDLDLSSRKQETKYFVSCRESKFEGVFDGNNKTLYNVNQTLFFCTDEKAVIKNLTLKNVDIKARYAYHTGVISNENYGLIHNVHVEGRVLGYDYTGGITGKHEKGSIQHSSFTGDVEGWNYVGGLAGLDNYVGSYVKNYVKGSITGKEYVGGLLGKSGLGTIDSCYVIGTVTGERLVGGLVGLTQATIQDVYTIVNVTGTDYASGGIVGANWWGEINNSYSLGTVTGNRAVGGIGVGDRLKVQNTFSLNDILSKTDQGSGLIFNENDENVLTNCYQYEGQLINGQLAQGESIVTKQQLLDIGWYRDVLQLDETIWDLSPVLQGYYPQLKNIPNQENIPIE